MSNNKSIIAFIKAISGQANVLTIPRVYIDVIGKGDRSAHKEALILSQSVYWSDRSQYQDGWFRKTYKEWLDELGINHDSMDRLVNRLVNLDLMETKISVNNDKFYHPKLEVLVALIEEFYKDPSTHNAYTPLPIMRIPTLDIDQTETASQLPTVSEFFGDEKKEVKPSPKRTAEDVKNGIIKAMAVGAESDTSLTEALRRATFREVSENRTTRQYMFDLKEWGATAETIAKCAEYCHKQFNTQKDGSKWREGWHPTLVQMWENYRSSQSAPEVKVIRPPQPKVIRQPR